MPKTLPEATAQDTLTPDLLTPDLLTPQAVAARLSLTPRAVLKLIRAGELPAVRTGHRTIRVPAKALAEWVEAQNEAARDALLPPARMPSRLSLADVLAGLPAPDRGAPATGDALTRLAETGTQLRGLLLGSPEREEAAREGFAQYFRNHAAR